MSAVFEEERRKLVGRHPPSLLVLLESCSLFGFLPCYCFYWLHCCCSLLQSVYTLSSSSCYLLGKSACRH